MMRAAQLASRRGRSAAATRQRQPLLHPPPSACRLSLDQSRRRKCRQKSAVWGTLTARDARSGDWTSQGGKVLKRQGPFLLKTDNFRARSK